MNEKLLEEIKHFIQRYNTFLIVSHIQPDGDALSSILSMGFGLRRYGKRVEMAIDSPVPEVFRNIPLCDQVQEYPVTAPFDALFFIDGSSPDRMGRFAKYLDEKPSVIIDHHRSAVSFGSIQWVEPTAAAAAQMVLAVNRYLDIVYDPVLATINLLGLQTDSGFFRYSNTTAELLKDASLLVEWGAQPYFNASTVLDNKKTEEFALLTKMIEEIKLSLSGHLVYSVITQEMLLKTGCREEDTTGFIGELRSIKGVECAILFIETETAETRVSFRSKKWFDVSEVAVHFGGGGHLRASGCTLKGNLSANVETVIQYVQRRMTENNPMNKYQNSLS